MQVQAQEVEATSGTKNETQMGSRKRPQDFHFSYLDAIGFKP